MALAVNDSLISYFKRLPTGLIPLHIQSYFVLPIRTSCQKFYWDPGWQVAHVRAVV